MSTVTPFNEIIIILIVIISVDRVLVELYFQKMIILAKLYKQYKYNILFYYNIVIFYLHYRIPIFIKRLDEIWLSYLKSIFRFDKVFFFLLYKLYYYPTVIKTNPCKYNNVNRLGCFR